MREEKCCCNCSHCARWRTKSGIECHCDLTDRYLGYLDVMAEDNNCKHWEKETKWDLQDTHDSEIRADERRKFAEWLDKKEYLRVIEYDKYEDFEGNITVDMREEKLDVDEVLDEYEKEEREK